MPETIEMTLGEAIREALAEELSRDPTVFIMGEDVGRPGGIFMVTKGLYEEFGTGPRDGHPHRGGRHRGAGGGRGHDRHEAHRRADVHRFSAARHGAAHQPGRQDALHDRGSGQGADGAARNAGHRPRRGGPTLAEPARAGGAHPRSEGRDALDPLRRQRVAQGGHPRRQSGDLSRTQDVLQHRQRAGADPGIPAPVGRGRRETGRPGRDAGGDFAHGARGVGRGRNVGAGRHQRRGG